MVEITVNTDITEIENYIMDSTVFYTFNYELSQAEPCIIVGVSVTSNKKEKILELKVNYFGRPLVTVAISNSMGLFKEKLTLNTSMIEMINNFDKSRLSMIMEASISGSPLRPENGVEKESVGAMIKFRETVLPYWIEKYPSMAI